MLHKRQGHPAFNIWQGGNPLVAPLPIEIQQIHLRRKTMSKRQLRLFMILFATLFLLTAITVFAVNTYSDSAGKVIPPGWCHIHGEVDRVLVDERLVCFECNN